MDEKCFKKCIENVKTALKSKNSLKVQKKNAT